MKTSHFRTAGHALLIRSIRLAAVALPFVQNAAADTAATVDAVQSRIESLDAPNGGTSPATTYQSKFSVSTSTDKSTASLDATGWVSSLGGGSFLTGSLTAKAPFDSSKSDVQDLGSLSGLTAGTQAHLAVAWSYWSAMPTRAVKDVLGLQTSSYIAQLYGGWPWEHPNLPGAPTLVDVLITLKLDTRTDLLITTDNATYKKIIAELNKEIEAFNAKNATATGSKPLPSVTAVADYSKIAGEATRDYYAIADAYSPWAPSFAFTLDGNQQSFTYVQTSSPTKATSESKDGAGASLALLCLHKVVQGAAVGAGVQSHCGVDVLELPHGGARRAEGDSGPSHHRRVPRALVRNSRSLSASAIQCCAVAVGRPASRLPNCRQN